MRRHVVLLGNPGTKRTIYLEQAAEASRLPVLLVEWKDWQEHLPEGSYISRLIRLSGTAVPWEN